MKRRLRGYARQGKGRRGCFNLEHLIFAPHDFKAAELMSSFSSHLQERWDGLPGSPLRARQRRLIRPKPARQARRLWYDIPSEVFCRELQIPKEEWFTDAFYAVSSFLVDAIKKEGPSLNVEACLHKPSKLETRIARSNWSKNPTYHTWWWHYVMVTMRRDSPFTAINATHLQTLRKWEPAHYPPLVHSPFLSSISQKEREKSWRTIQEKSHSNVRVLGEIWRLKRMTMISFPKIFPNL